MFNLCMRRLSKNRIYLYKYPIDKFGKVNVKCMGFIDRLRTNLCTRDNA